MALFQVLAEDGKVLKEARKSYDHYKRCSMRCAAEQKFLDSLYVPGAAEGRIQHDYSPGEPLTFRFAGGRSEHYFS